MTPVTGVIDLMAWASRLLALVVDGFASRDVPLPRLCYVSPGAIPVYDTEQVTVNVASVTDGRAGGGVLPSVSPYAVEQYLDLSVAIIRETPTEAPTGSVDAAVLARATGRHLTDLAVLRAVLTDIREQCLLTPDPACPMQIPYCRPEGPLGGVVAAVAGVGLQVFTAQPPP